MAVIKKFLGAMHANKTGYTCHQDFHLTSNREILKAK
jgi:hypothetical protein